ncbi:hypothetical protein [Actinoplanes sp. NPDC020271]|uniref:hypothetical protein n=1 Tax=Actinoplanes sp. NPDC020271 TaxID=3363896 RepID=UPI0037BCB847
MSGEHVRRLTPIVERYGEQRHGSGVDEPDRLHADGLAEVRTGPVGLVRDLQDLHVLGTLVQTTWTVVRQATRGLRDAEPIKVSTHASGQNSRLKAAAPQPLIVPA